MVLISFNNKNSYLVAGPLHEAIHGTLGYANTLHGRHRIDLARLTRGPPILQPLYTTNQPLHHATDVLQVPLCPLVGTQTGLRIRDTRKQAEAVRTCGVVGACSG